MLQLSVSVHDQQNQSCSISNSKELVLVIPLVFVPALIMFYKLQLITNIELIIGFEFYELFYLNC